MATIYGFGSFTDEEKQLYNEAVEIMEDVQNNPNEYTDQARKMVYTKALKLLEKLPKTDLVESKKDECIDFIDIINCGFYRDALILLESHNSAMQNLGYILMSNISDKEIEKTKHLYDDWMKSRHDAISEIIKVRDDEYDTTEKEIEELEDSINRCGVFEIIKRLELKGKLDVAKEEKERIDADEIAMLEKMGIYSEEDGQEGITKNQEEVIRRRFPDIEF